MKCEWCYVPFEAPTVREAVVASVIRRVAELDFTFLTIGGGDPFQYRFIGSTLQLAKSLRLFVHVDTHGLGLRESQETLSLLQVNVDLLGLPVDGSTAAIHDRMRQSPGHFNRVMQQLRWLADLRSRIKLNTLVSAANIDSLPSLSELIAKLQPSRWSIYQYWPLGPAARVQMKHSVPDPAFAEATERVRATFQRANTVIEINPRESRRDTYPIIQHDGEVFVHAPQPENTFLHLGSIFRDETMNRVLSHCAPDRPSAAARYTPDSNADTTAPQI